MIVKNFFGTAFDFIPKEVLTRAHRTHINEYINVKTQNNIIYLMVGEMPSTDELYEIDDTVEFEATYADSISNKITGLDFIYHYDVEKKERIIKKDWKDALDLTYGADGTITWFAVKLTEAEKDFDVPYSLSQTQVRDWGTYSPYNMMKNDNSSFYIYSGTTNQVFTFNFREAVNPDFLRIRMSRSWPTIVEGSNDNSTWTNIGGGTVNGDTTLDIKQNTKYKHIRFRMTISAWDSWYVYQVEFFNEATDNMLIYSDSVGVWEDIDRVIITESLSGTQGSPNIFKDFTLAMRDTCNEEFLAEPTTEYTDNTAGLIFINAISDNVITNPERLEDLIISGTTTGIENGQIIEIVFNGVIYQTSLFESAWTITVPAEDTQALDFDTTYTVTLECRDRAGNLGTATKDVFVKAANVAPVITVVESVTIDEDSTTQIPLTVTDSDGSVTGIVVVADNGEAIFNSETGIINYAPNANFNGAETIRITATDDLNANTIVNISVTVTSVNDNPTFTITESAITDEDTLISIPFTNADIDGTVDLVEATASNGTITIEDNNILYTPNANFYGVDTIIVTATDDEAGTVIKNVSLTINSVNDNPVITIADTVTNEDTVVNLPYTASDIEGGVVITTIGTNGSASVDLENNQIIFTPDANFVGTGSIEITVTDSEDAFITKTVNVEVASVNDNPLLTIGTVFTMNENVSEVITYTTVDIDGTVDSVTTTTSPNATIVVDMVAETITYTPNVEFTGEDSFTVTATDNEGGTDEKIITITVENVDAPATITVDSLVLTDEETALEIPFTFDDIDGEVTPTVSALNGTATILDGVITYTPNTDYEGSDTITLIATDSNSETTETTIDVTVTHFDNPAVITVDAAATVDEDSSVVIPYTATDVDGTITTTVSATEGVVTVDATDITYTPTANFNGTTTITLTVTDSVGGETTAETVVTVGNIDDAASFTIDTSVSLDENTSLEIPYTVTDIDGDIVDTTVTALNATVTVSEGVITYTPTADYEGSDTITLTVTDSEGGVSNTTVDVTVNHVDTPSVITITSGTTMDENTSLDITFTVSDVDGAITGQTVTASNGDVSTTVDTISYTPTTDFVGDDTIILTVTDSDGETTVENITVTVNEVVVGNTPAEVTLPETLEVAVDSLTDIDYTASDIDGDNLTTTVTNSGNGSVSINTEVKRISYDAPSIAGNDTITLTVNDGTVDTIKTITVTISNA